MPAILDVAIGTLFVFLLFSLIVSASVELLMAINDQRSKFLREGLTEMVGPERVNDLLRHGLINALSKPEKNSSAETPSYISPGAFVTALFDLILTKWSPQGENTSAPLDLKTLRAAIEALPEDKDEKDDSCLRQALLSLLRAKGESLDSFRFAVEGWYNDAMDRVSGWYKRHSQFVLLILGFLLAIILNVDTIHIVQTLSADPKLRETVIEHAERFLDSETSKAQPATATATATATTDGTHAPEVAFHESIARLGGLGIPFGWSYAQWLRCWPQDDWEKVFRVAVFLLGCFITALAGSLGAPFWFDLLGRFMNVRAAGRSPIEKSATDSTPIPGMPSMSKF